MIPLGAPTAAVIIPLIILVTLIICDSRDDGSRGSGSLHIIYLYY